MHFTGVMVLAQQAAQNPSIFHPDSPAAESIRDLSLLILAISAFIFVVVEGVLLYCLVRFRRRSEPPHSEPPQFYGSHPVETAWTVAPTLIVFVMVLVTTRTLWLVDPNPPQPQAGDPALFVTVVGHQWWWEYRYKNYDGRELKFITANELHVPASSADTPRRVQLRLESDDVIHSFWVPQLAGKTDVIPGHPNHMWFQTEREGLFVGQCAEYCGTQHANMLLRVQVDSPEEFERWLEQQSRPAVEDPAAAAGKAAFFANSCVKCHRIRGTDAQGDYAPDLTHLMSRRTLASGMIPNTRKNLLAWVTDPKSIKPGCLMPAFKLRPQQYEAIVDYLSTLK
jgi:cytochrome c oxidase subunit 2